MAAASTPTWGRFVRFIAEDGNRELCGEPVDADIDVGLALAAKHEIKVKVLSASSALDTRAQFTGEVATISKLLSPLSARDIGTIRCVGLNFKDHAAELGVSLPQVPTIFTKPCTALTGALDPIALPRSAPKAVDSEVELAVVIAEDCKDVTPTEAMEYVLGYTIANDLTARDLQSQTSQWGYCKGFDGFCPLGPVLASRQAVGDVGGLAMRTELDGQILQDSTPDQMIFSVGEMISHLSRDTTLPKGTVILTGTPSGIGHSYSPPRYLKAGSRLKVSITPKLGTLVNPVVASPQQHTSHL
ncbi:hypothetical protein NLU13_4330 [Sarocladium strictum]|uniref:Fumarylacetoacetase-like C-terminal domain-containing protein n=1 Tax=Sarocladium strictum TaxID=5046 RepID=A0AA39GJ09_SARSR|nr:hypothetical protein NLU13_4330 [Sarocladium strictum]